MRSGWTDRSPGGRISVVVVLFLLALLAAPTAWAADQDDGDEPEESAEAEEPEEEPRLFVLPADSVQGDVSDIVTDRINEAVRERFATLGGLELLPTFEALQGEAGGEAAAAALTEAEAQYTSGIGLVHAGEYDEASETLQMAVSIMEENVAELDDMDVLSDAKLHMAVALHETGFDLDARDAIEHYAHLVPDADLDPDLVPEALIELYDDEAGRVEAAGDGHLTIEADHEGAQVYIDTEHVGQTPVTVDDVGFGERYVVVRHDDLLWSDTVQVRARGEEQTIEAELRDPDEADEVELPSFYVDLREMLQSGQFGTDLEPYLQELAHQTGAAYIAWVLVVPEDYDYAAAPFVYRVDDGTVMQGDNVSFDRQLSGIRSQADRVADTVATALVHIPDDQVVAEVDMAEEADVDEQPVTDEELAAMEDELDDEQPDETVDDEPVAQQQDEEQVAMADDEQPSEELPVPDATPQQDAEDTMLDEPPEQRDNTMRYLGWGGLGVVATGAVATTVLLLMRSGDPAPGMDVEVEW